VGKWSSLKGTLPPLPGESPQWMDKVRAEKDEIVRGVTANPLTFYTSEYNAARAEKDKLGEREAALNIRIEALQQLILSALEESGSDIWRGNGYSFSEKPEPYASIQNKLDVNEHFLPLSAIEQAVIDGDVAYARELLDRAKQNLGIVSIPWQTLNALVKAEAEAGELMLEEREGEETPVVRCSIPGVNVFLKSSINRRKAGEK
jgi:hypothetical protein